MKLPSLMLLAALLPGMASAATLNYELDRGKSNLDEDTIAMCALPDGISMDSKEDLATVVMKKLIASNIEITKIQASGGSMSGGGIEAPYTGDYRVRVSITKIPPIARSIYPLGIYQRVEVTTFGSPAAPAAFTVTRELLNYRESAELGEDSICTNFSYRLK